MHQISTALIALNASLNNQNLFQILTNSKVQVINKVPINTKEGILLELENLKPNMVFISSTLPGVIDLIQVIAKAKQISPRTKIILTVSENDKTKILSYFLSGINALIWTENIYELLENAIQQVNKGCLYICGTTAYDLRTLLQNQQNNDAKSDLGLLGHLTDREIEVLRSLTHGINYKQISKILYISESTVKTHINNIFTKLNVNDRTQAVLYALHHGIESLLKKPHILTNITGEIAQK